MSQYTHQKNLRETAVAWFLHMQQADIEHPDRGQFEAWLLQNTAHQQAYEEVTRLWDGFDSTTELKSLHAAMEQKAFLEKQKRSRKVNQTVMGLLGFVLVATMSLFGYQSWQAQPTLQMAAVSQIGQAKQTVLEDGTQLNLNANTELEITYFRDKRVAKLKRGEVIFEVARDEARPFIVDSGYGRITVLGTRFAVNRLQQLVRVSVDYGRVQVDTVDANGRVIKMPIILMNGQVAEVRQNQAPKRTAQLASDAFGFTQGIISFEKAGLEEIAETLSRYRKPAVVVQTPITNDAQITAIIKVKEVEKFIANIPDIAAVKVQSSPEQTVLISQPVTR